MKLYKVLVLFLFSLKGFSGAVSPHDPILKKSASLFYRELNLNPTFEFMLNNQNPFYNYTNLNSQDATKVSKLDWTLTGTFPRNFLWGFAVSAHQLEGNNKLNDWWEYETLCDGKLEFISTCFPKFIRNSGRATDHYQKFMQEDLDKVKQLKANSFRFSVEWSRLEPKDNVWDMKEVQYYRNYLMELKKRGLKPSVTLWHFTLPNWIQAIGKGKGWQNPETIKKFTEFAAFCAKNFGDLVDIWTTHNEPVGNIMAGTMAGYFPPGQLLNWKGTKKALLNLARAHNAAYDAIKANDKVDADGDGVNAYIGLVQNMNAFVPNNPKNKDDLMAADRLDYFYHWHTIDAAYSGKLDTNWNGLNDEVLQDGKRKLDFLGINYYGTFMASPHFAANKFFYWNRLLPELGFSPWVPNNDDKNVPHNSLGWEVYPQGLYEIITAATKRYNKIPIMITENGFADGKDRDYRRLQYVIAHLQMVLKAIQEGANVQGYYYWSLIDNFEWREGFRPDSHFGIYHIDNGGKDFVAETDSLVRTPSKSVDGIRTIFTKNAITKDLLNKYGSFEQLPKN